MERRALEIKKAEGRSASEVKKKIREADERYRLRSIVKKGIEATKHILIATHIAKGIHPALEVSNVTNLLVQLDALPFWEEIGSHLLAADKSLVDATGNAIHNRSAYEFYLLIDLKFEGRSLYQLLKTGDEDVISVLALLTPEVTGVGNAQG